LLVLVTLFVGDLDVRFLLSILVTAAAPSIVLKSEELVASTSLSAGGVGVTVFLWTEFEVPASVVTVAAHVGVRWSILGRGLDNLLGVELLGDLTIPHRESSVGEVNWGSEAVLLVLGGWDDDTVVVSNILGGSLADLLVGDLAQVLDDLVAVTLLVGLGLVVQGLDELVLVLDGVLGESDSLSVDHSIEEWPSLDVVFVVVLIVGVVFKEIVFLDLLIPDSEISDNLSGVGSFLILRLVFLDLDVDAVSLEVAVPKGSWVVAISGLHSSEDAWLNLVVLGVSKAEGHSLLSDSVLGSTGEPLSGVVLGQTPGNP